MSGKTSRTKGHNFEREIARQLREIFPDARRGLQYQDGIGCPDVTGTPFHIECKVGQKPNIRGAMKQALRDRKEEKIPVAVIKDDRHDPIAVMQWKDFLELVALSKECILLRLKISMENEEAEKRIVTL